jgi:hypothetical protein
MQSLEGVDWRQSGQERCFIGAIVSDRRMLVSEARRNKIAASHWQLVSTSQLEEVI